MGLSVAEAQQRIDSREFAEWLALESVEPITDRRGDIQAAVIAYIIAQANSRKRLRPEDFILAWDDRTAGRGMQNGEQMEALASKMAAAGIGTLRSSAGGGPT